MTLTKKQEREKRWEERQYQKLRVTAEKERRKGYLLVILVLILLVDILDNLTTSMSGNMTSCFITEFFVNGQVFGRSYTYEEGLSLHNTISILGYALALLAPFYKALADKFGRKPLFVFSTFGMAAGLLIIYFCNSYTMFLVGSFTTSFFLGHDIQILYILEEAPSNRRATIYSMVKGLGGLSSILIPMMRTSLMHNDATLWRNVYRLPGLCGLGIMLLVLIFGKDTHVYVDKRVKELSVPYEERLQQRQAEKGAGKTEHKSGVIPAMKYIFRHKELRVLILIKLLFDAAIVAMTNFESIMHKAGMTTAEITTAEFYFPIIYCVSVMLSGVLADHIGRKKTIVLFGSICAIAFVFFIVSTNGLWQPRLVGLFYGLYLGGYWIGRDYMEIISTEMVPTGIRASIIGAEGLLVGVGMAIGFIFINVGILFLPIWLTCLIFAVPCVTISTILLFLKVKETKGVDYEAITDLDE